MRSNAIQLLGVAVLLHAAGCASPGSVMPLERRAVDDARRRLIAEEVFELMKERNPDVLADRGAVMIGPTSHDYIRGRQGGGGSPAGMILPRTVARDRASRPGSRRGVRHAAAPRRCSGLNG